MEHLRSPPDREHGQIVERVRNIVLSKSRSSDDGHKGVFTARNNEAAARGALDSSFTNTIPSSLISAKSHDSAALGSFGRISSPRRKTFHADLFVAYVKAYMHYSAACYSCAISVGDAIVHTGSEGYERIKPDLKPYEKMVKIDPATTRLDIASMSKTVTAVAMIKLLLAKGISLDKPMYTYLPPQTWGWVLHEDMKKITFRQLLTHTSRIASGVRHLPDVRARLKKPVDANIAVGEYYYANFNYALLRVLSYKILGGYYGGVAPADDKLATQHGAAFCEMVRTTVLEPSGILNATWGPSAGHARALIYPYPLLDFDHNNIHGAYWSPDNGEITAGSSSLHLSSVEMIKFLMNIKNLLSKDWVSFMDQSLAGVDNVGTYDYGSWYGHGGLLGVFSSEGFHSWSYSQWVKFPENSTYVEATATSGSPGLLSMEDAWVQFYNWSWW